MTPQVRKCSGCDLRFGTGEETVEYHPDCDPLPGGLQVVDVEEEWDEWGVRGDRPTGPYREMYGVEIFVEMSDGRTLEGYGEADSKGVARARAWDEVFDALKRGRR